MRWTTTVLACDEPEVVAAFWAALLDSEVVRISDNFFAVRHGSAWLATQKSPHPQATWPAGDRPVLVHLDVAVNDLREAVRHAVELGATEEETQPHPDSWRVMRAPGGHVFCLSDHIQDYLSLSAVDVS
jgi:hypothetical protein